MTLTQLEYIIAVAREQNFHRAAKACYVTQPTLSALIKKLEEELDAVIFDRSKSPTVPTKIGAAIIEQAKITIAQSKQIFEIVDAEKAEIKGELRLGIIPTIAPYLLPLFLGKIKQKYPLVNLSIWELTTQNCLKALDREEIDLAILATKEDKQRYHQDNLYEEQMLLYIHPKHPLAKQKKISVDHLKAEDMWLLEEGHCLRDEIIKLCHLRNRKRPFDLDIKIGSLESLRYLVQENHGYTLIPKLATLKISQKEYQLLRNFSEPKPKRTVNFTTRRLHLRKSIIQALKTEIMPLVQEKL